MNVSEWLVQTVETLLLQCLRTGITIYKSKKGKDLKANALPLTLAAFVFFWCCALVYVYIHRCCCTTAGAINALARGCISISIALHVQVIENRSEWQYSRAIIIIIIAIVCFICPILGCQPACVPAYLLACFEDWSCVCVFVWVWVECARVCSWLRESPHSMVIDKRSITNYVNFPNGQCAMQHIARHPSTYILCIRTFNSIASLFDFHSCHLFQHYTIRYMFGASCRTRAHNRHDDRWVCAYAVCAMCV